MTEPIASRPQLSYVLAATSAAELHDAAAWLSRTPLSPELEIVLAAPGPVMSRVAARSIPAGIKLVSAYGEPDRRAVRVAGARMTTGLVVMVIDCNEDLSSRFRDPFETGADSSGIDPLAEPLDQPGSAHGIVSHISELPRSDLSRLPEPA
ncbi:MAG: hypothetical protein AB7L66_07805 [Gemmatimonadales bacterium]